MAGVPMARQRKCSAVQLFKTEMCKFYMQGFCEHGDVCSYGHNLNEIRQKPDLTATSMCRRQVETGSCQDPHCRFAHAEEELRATCEFYKVKMCRFAKSGRCKSGEFCRFAHFSDELRPPTLPVNDDRGEVAGDDDPVPCLVGTPLCESKGFKGSDVGPFSCEDQAGVKGSKLRQPSKGMPRRASARMALRKQSLGQKAGRQNCNPEAGEADGVGVSGDNSSQHVTTLLVSNVPPYLTQGALLSMLEDLTDSMHGQYDFFFCPWDDQENHNLGYALINFVDPAFAAIFKKRWSNNELCRGCRAKKPLRVTKAALQGLEANVDLYSSMRISLSSELRLRPLLRHANGSLQPLPLKKDTDNDAASIMATTPSDSIRCCAQSAVSAMGDVVKKPFPSHPLSFQPTLMWSQMPWDMLSRQVGASQVSLVSSQVVNMSRVQQVLSSKPTGGDASSRQPQGHVDSFNPSPGGVALQGSALQPSYGCMITNGSVNGLFGASVLRDDDTIPREESDERGLPWLGSSWHDNPMFVPALAGR